ncbi:MAG: (2Fe-2S)-binding protein [Pseudomonadota bacterium]|nr:(2Fe-2S)-binding protein [Pseudomonadota bacterium]
MYVCVCSAVTDRQIRAAVSQGASTMRDLRQALNVCAGCGRCGPLARDLLRTFQQEVQARTAAAAAA